MAANKFLSLDANGAEVEIAALVSSLGAQGWPSLRQGSWSISRTIEAQGSGSPKVVTTTRCMTP